MNDACDQSMNDLKPLSLMRSKLQARSLLVLTRAARDAHEHQLRGMTPDPGTSFSRQASFKPVPVVISVRSLARARQKV